VQRGEVDQHFAAWRSTGQGESTRLSLTLAEGITALSYLVGALVFWWSAQKRGMATDGVGFVVAVGFVAGIVGAKVTQLLAQGALSNPAALDPRSGGRALLGGLIFGWIGVEIAKRSLGIRRSTGDHFALALPAGEAVGRLGCHFGGCCYGAICDLPWAIEQQGAMRHPAQLYSAASAGTLFLTLCWLRPRVPREGDLFRLYLVGFGATRFVLEFFRWRENLLLGLSPMQWLCMELVISVGLYMAWRRRREARLD